MVNIGNSVALLALLAWPMVIIVMFRFMTLERALIWSLLGGYMFLPQVTEINFPGIPAFNKTTIPNLTAFVVIIAMSGKLPQLLPQTLVGRALVMMLVLSPALTVLNNLEPVRFGYQMIGNLLILDPSALERAELPALRFYDSASELARQLIVMVPFFLARHYLRTEAALTEILRALAVGGLIYALPMLFEVRFSPQLHTWVYGFFQHDFIQAMRAGGFRPFVFMPHGLWVAFFAFMAAMAGVALAMTAVQEKRRQTLLVSLILIALVPLCKSLGVIVYSLLLIPALLFLPARAHLLFGLLISFLVLAYPMMRGAGLIPTQALVERIEQFNPDRAQSLEYRFDNEDRVIAHVRDKPLLGWGGWGRFMPHDPETGTSRVVVDGLWVITIGQYGWLGYLALFGLLVLPLLSLFRQANRAHAPPLPITVSALVLIYAANLLDLLPNATLVPFSLLIGGALLGYAEELRSATDKARALSGAKDHHNVIIGASTATPSRLVQAGKHDVILGHVRKDRKGRMATGADEKAARSPAQPRGRRNLL
ncbi:MAG: hypothetical protein ACXIVG_10275 [Pararhodobacter sp.]